MKTNCSLLLAALVAVVATPFVSADTLYVSNTTDNDIAVINSVTGTTTTIGSSSVLDEPSGLAINGAGDLFIANFGSNSIEEFNPFTNTFSSFSTDLGSGTIALAFDSAGNLYVGEGEKVQEFTASVVNSGTGGTPTTFATLDGAADSGIAVDSAGDLYVTLENGSIARIDPQGQSFDISITGLSTPAGIAYGPGGDLYVADNNNSDVQKIDAELLGSIFVSNDPANHLSDPVGLAFGSGSDLYVTDAGNNTVTEYNSTGVLENTFSTDLDFPFGIAIVPGDAVPEPSTYALLLGGLAALYFYRRRRASAPVVD